MRALVLVAVLLTTACTQTQMQDIATASALPAYIVAGEAALARQKPYTEAELTALKAADMQAYSTVTVLNADQMRRADEVHRRIQGL